MKLTFWPCINVPGAIVTVPTPNFAFSFGGMKFWTHQVEELWDSSFGAVFRPLTAQLNFSYRQTMNISKITISLGKTYCATRKKNVRKIPYKQFSMPVHYGGGFVNLTQPSHLEKDFQIFFLLNSNLCCLRKSVEVPLHSH